ncbi:MAG: chorismate synthase [Candidatus Caenarcaniphilales bacterium]|jgi:chorismate synthase|nr:chorismate synthase [Candidatus Caenarcaniphilales bacterium]
MLRFLTAGESHGPELNIIIDGIPANLEILAEDINQDLSRRQAGYGRGGRMKIEKDQVIFSAGVRHGKTMGGAPVALRIINKDHEKWLDVMSSKPVDINDETIRKSLEDKYISKVRPGHADFAGAIKYQSKDVRDILERSSARETTSRVAVGAVCKKFLREFGVEIFSHVLQIGKYTIEHQNKWWLDAASYQASKALVESSELRIYDPSNKYEKDIKDYIDQTRKAGDTLGGLLEVFALGLPIGLGSHVQWDRRLDGLIAQSLMSVHTVKSVAFGAGTGVAALPGSQVQDQIYVNPENDPRYIRHENKLGGIEGGMSNGMPVVCTVAVKPIPTLIAKLDSIDLDTRDEAKSHFERSDICVVPAAGVVLEAMLAMTLATAFLEKFGGDSIEETKANYNSYLSYCKGR